MKITIKEGFSHAKHSYEPGTQVKFHRLVLMEDSFTGVGCLVNLQGKVESVCLGLFMGPTTNGQILGEDPPPDWYHWTQKVKFDLEQGNDTSYVNNHFISEQYGI